MVITNVNQVVYQGDGVTTAFPFTFRIIDATDIKLLLLDSDGTETDITSDYYVDTVNNTVHYPGYAPGAEPPAEDQPPKVQAGQKLVVYRELPITQEKDLGEKWPFYVIELGLDKLTMILQQIFDWWGRALKISQGGSVDGFDTNIYPEAGKVIAVNEDGDGFTSVTAMTEENNAWNGKGMRIRNIAGPSSVTDAATKDYVDQILNGFVLAGDSRTVPFDTLAQLRVAAIEAGQIAFTLGYHDINDGGACVYSIRTATLLDVDDGGSIIILDNGNVAELITDGTVCPEQFGAKGDGTTNDTIPLQKCFAFGKVIKLGRKTYALDGCLEVTRNMELITDTTVLTVLNDGLKDYDAVIKIVRNGTSFISFHHRGKLTIECNSHCNVGLWIDARCEALELDWLQVTYARVWGVYDSSSNANFKTAHYLSTRYCGQKVKAKASYTASDGLEVTYVSAARMPIDADWFDNVFLENSLSQFDFVLDDSDYLVDTRMYRSHWFGSGVTDTGVKGKVNFAVRTGTLNSVPADYIDKDVFVAIGGGFCVLRQASSCWDIGFHQSTANSRLAKIMCLYNCHWGSLTSEYDTVGFTLELNYGLTIEDYYEEYLGSALSSDKYKNVFLATYYKSSPALILNGTYPALTLGRILTSTYPSQRKRQDYSKVALAYSLRDIAKRLTLYDLTGADTNYSVSVNCTASPKQYTDVRNWFNSGGGITLTCSDVSLISYYGFTPIEIYAQTLYNHEGATYTIALAQNLIDAGYTILNAVDNKLAYDVSTKKTIHIKIVLFGKEFSVFIDEITPATNAS